MVRKQRGFTLIELMVAIAVMALMAALSWRGLDGMHTARDQTAQRANDLMTLQAGLSQWGADLDAMVEPSFTAPSSATAQPTLDWDGRALRVVRRSTTEPEQGWLVVAWTRRGDQSQGQWLRWQSPAVKTRRDLQDAWQQAALWAQNPGDDARRREVAVLPIVQWQVFYHRGDTWSNPLSTSSDLGAALLARAGNSAPDGIRLVLTLPAGHALSGTVTRDWIRPNYVGTRT